VHYIESYTTKWFETVKRWIKCWTSVDRAVSQSVRQQESSSDDGRTRLARQRQHVQLRYLSSDETYSSVTRLSSASQTTRWACGASGVLELNVDSPLVLCAQRFFAGGTAATQPHTATLYTSTGYTLALPAMRHWRTCPPPTSNNFIFCSSLYNCTNEQFWQQLCVLTSPNIHVFVFCNSNCGSSVVATWSLFTVLFCVIFCATKVSCSFVPPPTPDPGDTVDCTRVIA